MGKMIAFCGLDCSQCIAFLATQADDDQKRAETAQIWSKQYNADIKPEDINCDGCHSNNGRSFLHCNVCEIRRCGMEKQISNCAHCSEFACEKLSALLDYVPQAKEELNSINKALQ
jgi:hypothetical protein